MAKINFLLGKGERLTEQVKVNSGPMTKIAPYTFSEAKTRLEPMLADVVRGMENLPTDACPDDFAVATITMNPEYIAKTYHPGDLLRAAGLIAVGSRSKTVTPEKRSNDRDPVETVTTELFVAGTRPAFKKWAADLENWNETSPGAAQLVEIEEINFPLAEAKIKHVDYNEPTSVFEVVLHINEDLAEHHFLNTFKQYLKHRQISATFERRFYAGGLCFLEVEAPTERVDEIAQFSLVRVMRTMPSLRLLRPAFRSSGMDKNPAVELPNQDPLDSGIKVAIFDGGIPDDHPITRWATPYQTAGLGPAAPELTEHGVSVTSAFLFGHLDPKKPLSRPYAYVDHYRVLDNVPGQNPYELYEVLDRIQDVLSTNSYDFINLSLGPFLPIEDDEVHAWTAVLDEYLSDGKTLATIAVGNEGEGDPAIQANRVQVPADCVNALAVGACDVPDDNWQRAPYSSVGPGRSPGLVKPDLVDFGGSIQRPFLTLDAIDGHKLFATGGTSFSAPSVLRMGAGVKAHFGSALNALAIRTLLTHCTETSDIPMVEIGWGRAARDLSEIVICSDHVMRVVFQGRITASKFVRAPIPLPAGALQGKIKIKATLCYATPVDPHHPGNYTRSGLEVTFRPNKTIKRKVEEGEPLPMHANSKSFFGKARKKFQTEDELRRDAWKWENCLHAENSYLPKSLVEPTFDIHYNARIDGRFL